MNSFVPSPVEPAQDWRDLSLQAGSRCLIEASAGTGKTWTISVIYLRLLLEQRLNPTEIVVTTFTDAAAQELRERIRGRILWAIGISNSNAELTASTADKVLVDADEAWLRERWNDAASEFDPTRATADRHRLQLALVDLDRAPISTLHGLCRRILSELPFDSASAFDLGDMVSSDSIDNELIDDLIRRLGQSDGELSNGDQQWWNKKSDLRQHLRKALASGVVVFTISKEAVDKLMRPESALLLRACTDAASNFKRSNAALRTRLIELAEFIEGDDPRADVSSLAKGFSKALGVPRGEQLSAAGLESPVCVRAIEFAISTLPLLSTLPYAEKAAALARYQSTLREQRQQRLAARGQITFDALIERVARALDDPRSALADALFQRWPVALVDEFQDTDTQQYAILDAIYRDRTEDHALRGLLVMIGDPKQAIYRFRGGDIDAYLHARETATSELRLKTNFRSSRTLIDALNGLFDQAGRRLSSDVDHRIEYEIVVASSRNDETPYRIAGADCSTPLQLHYWHGDVPESAPERTAAALEACADQIVDLLASGDHTIGDEPLKPGDIAVLLPTNAQITHLRALLDERHVPCVATARSSVFDSDWARELQIVLHASLHPRDAGAVRAALATRLGGKSYQDLRDMGNDPAAFEAESQRYAAMGESWRREGVLAAIQRLLRERGIDLFAAGDAERAMTDLNHLGELLQAQAEQRIGAEQLLQWLAAQRNDGGDDAGNAADEQQLRIESDAARVRLMTLHMSKGLEFPIVILPLMWANANRDNDRIPVLHDVDSGQRVLSFGDDALEHYRRDGQDERYRLLYVALTRAIHSCHVYALPPDRSTNARSGDSPTDPKRAPLDAIIERLLGDRIAPTPIDGLAWKAGPWSWPSDSHYQRDTGRPGRPRTAMSEPPAAAFESRYSFTSLTYSQVYHTAEESPAVDEPDAATDPPKPPLVGDSLSEAGVVESTHPELLRLITIAGADFGNALHAIFEHRVIGATMATQTDLIRRCLEEQALSLRDLSLDRLVALVATRIQSTLDAPLLPQSAPGLTLANLKPQQLRAEMAFDFVLDDVSMTSLREACERHGEPALVPAGPLRELRGLMAGKIDLVFEFKGRFHVLDYKSNRLGEHLSDYQPAALEYAMDAHHYRFQALLYTIAVDRYLRQRIADYSRHEHLGEAIYLFVRATGIDAQSGIWARRFDDGLIDAVDIALGRTIKKELA